MQKEDWKAPLGILFIGFGLLVAAFVAFLPDLNSVRTAGLIATAICVVGGVVLIGARLLRR